MPLDALLDHISNSDQDQLREILAGTPAQPDLQAARCAVSQALELLEPHHPKVAKLLRDAEADVLAYLAFPGALALEPLHQHS